MTRAAEFYAMDPDELENRLIETRRELLNLRFQLATGQLDNVAQLKTVRRDVARVLTILREMEIAQTEGVAFEAPTPQPGRLRAQRRDADELRAGAIELDDDDEDRPAEPVASRVRRSRKVEAAIDEPSDEGDEAEESARTRARGRRSRKVENTAEVPADADEEQ
jgi:large subunit ribosomal protein L29